MANHQSALKARRSSERRAIFNKNRRSRMKTLVKKAKSSFKEGDSQAKETCFKLAQADIMRNVAKGLLHKRAAARRISSLALGLKAPQA